MPEKGENMKNYFLKLLSLIGLAPTQDEKDMVRKIKNSYSSLKVSGRGVVSVSADEVINNPEFRNLYARASAIVEREKEK